MIVTPRGNKGQAIFSHVFLVCLIALRHVLTYCAVSSSIQPLNAASTVLSQISCQLTDAQTDMTDFRTFFAVAADKGVFIARALRCEQVHGVEN